MKQDTFIERLFSDCRAEWVVFVVGGLAGVASKVVILNGGDEYFAGLFAGISLCAAVLSVSYAIPKLTRPAKQ